jgi:hypothetical protein
MALLGCPRGHMVAHETECLTRPGYSPSNPSSQKPIDSRGSDSGMVFRICALKRLVASDIRR